MTMVEKVARGITHARLLENKNLTDAVRAEQLEAFWKSYASDAIAAIEAMREPTEAMLLAVSSFEDITHIDQDPEYYWPRMIDAALNEKTT